MKLRTRFYKTSILALTVLISFAGCKKTLDINNDPNNPVLEQGTPPLVFPTAVIAVAAKTGGDLALLGGIWGEYFTQSAFSNQYKFMDAYDISSGIFNAPYSVLYSAGLINLQFVIDKSKESQDWNFYLMGTVMKAYTTAILVDLYDKIPYFEALQGASNLNPKFDDGYTIYKDLLSKLDSALGKDFTLSTNTSPGKADLVFGGDMAKWKQFANTLELKMYLRMVNAKPDEAKAGVLKLYNNNAQFLTKDAGVFSYQDIPNKDNPLYEQNIRSLNTPVNLRASRTFVSWLQQANDPRLVKFYGSANPNNMHQGDYLNAKNDPTYSSAASFIEKATDPVVFLSVAESYFLQAEARERYYNGDQAQALYNAGVTTSFTSLGLSGSSFVAPGGAYAYPTTGTLDQKIEAISVQKWASFPYGNEFIEGFFEKNRTGYPRTSPVYSTSSAYVPGQFVISLNSVLAPGQLPRRLVYPDAEVSRNTNTPALVPITTPVWWAK